MVSRVKGGSDRANAAVSLPFRTDRRLVLYCACATRLDRIPHFLQLLDPFHVPLHLFLSRAPPPSIQMAPILSNPNLRTKHSLIGLVPSFRRRLWFVRQLPHPRRQRLREGRGRGLLELRLGHRRLALLDFLGGQHPFYMYLFDVPRANELLQDRSFQVAATVNRILVPTMAAKTQYGPKRTLEIEWGVLGVGD